MYRIKLDLENRIIEYTYADTELPKSDGVLVESLPNGNAFDYKYINNEYIYDPIVEPVDESNEEYVTYDNLDKAVKAGVNSI